MLTFIIWTVGFLLAIVLTVGAAGLLHRAVVAGRDAWDQRGLRRRLGGR